LWVGARATVRVGGELEVAVAAGQVNHHAVITSVLLEAVDDRQAKVIRVGPLDFRKLVGQAREANLLNIEINKSAGC
jgi:hypothetical protein